MNIFSGQRASNPVFFCTKTNVCTTTADDTKRHSRRAGRDDANSLTQTSTVTRRRTYLDMRLFSALTSQNVWRQLTKDDTVWRQLTKDDTVWRQLTKDDTVWCQLTKDDTVWRQLTKDDTVWRQLTKDDAITTLILFAAVGLR